MRFKFIRKGLFYFAAFFCLISIVLSPAAIFFIYVAQTAYLEIDDENLIYKMITKKVIPLKSITSLALKPAVQAARKVGYATVNFANVIPLVVLYGGKKTTVSLNSYENPEEILRLLSKKSGVTVKDQYGQDIEKSK